SEEEGPLLGPGHRPAESDTGLVAVKFSSRYAGRIRKKVVRVQGVVAAEIVGIPVELRRARPGLYDDVRATPSAVLSIVERILNFELLDRIRRRYRQPSATIRGALGHIGAVTAGVHAVQHEVIVTAASAIGANLLAPSSQLCRIYDVRIRASRQTEKLCVIAIHEWQGHNCPLSDYASEGGILGLEQRRFDLDCLGDALYREFY